MGIKQFHHPKDRGWKTTHWKLDQIMTAVKRLTPTRAKSTGANFTVTAKQRKPTRRSIRRIKLSHFVQVTSK